MTDDTFRDDAPDASDDPDRTAVERTRPETEASYGIPTDREGMLPWSFVAASLATDRTFWVSTMRPDGRPHARPVWGVWVDGRFHCGGGERTRRVRNLAVTPAVTAHRESGDEVVIVEGTAERVTDVDEARLERIDAAYEEKYDVQHGTPAFAVHLDAVLAWRDYPTDATRWTFEENG
ncbi:pyridoxamine 5'-phosphate oxidase family protein [Halomicrococcus gelatinilyticus]|uniref:pyridoxamine 5'-phosphate oxidase family protein n=1 Tax=Halomicrococcus gelatinilyticus TaxID=1702103 RepID=UPI002E15D7CB